MSLASDLRRKITRESKRSDLFRRFSATRPIQRIAVRQNFRTILDDLDLNPLRVPRSRRRCERPYGLDCLTVFANNLPDVSASNPQLVQSPTAGLFPALDL